MAGRASLMMFTSRGTGGTQSSGMVSKQVWEGQDYQKPKPRTDKEHRTRLHGAQDSSVSRGSLFGQTGLDLPSEPFAPLSPRISPRKRAATGGSETWSEPTKPVPANVGSPRQPVPQLTKMSTEPTRRTQKGPMEVVYVAPRAYSETRLLELSQPRPITKRDDRPDRALEFSTKDLPPPYRGLFKDCGPGKIKCIASGKVFRSNDYRQIQAHWYRGSRKMYYDAYQCRRRGPYGGGETVFKRRDIGPLLPGDSTITLPVLGDITLQRPCRLDHLPLKKVLDPLGHTR